MRRAALSLLAVVSGVLLAFWFVLDGQARKLGDGLVRDAITLEGNRFTISGTKGEVFECAGLEADVAPDLGRTLPWSRGDVMAATNGSEPLDGPMRAALVEHGAWLTRTLACGRRSSIGPAPGVGPFADLRHGRRQSLPRLMESLTTLVPLAMREDLAQGAPAAALERCADVLTLSVAWLRLEGLESMLPILGPTRAVLPACQDALTAAPVAARLRFQKRLREVRILAPGYADVMAVERTQLGLRLFGAWLPLELDATLPATARAITRTQRETKFDRGLAATLALRLYWRKFDVGMRAIEEAAALAPAFRDPRIVAAQKKLAAPFLRRFLAADPVDPKYEMYAAYLDQLLQTLDTLAVVPPSR